MAVTYVEVGMSARAYLIMSAVVVGAIAVGGTVWHLIGATLELAGLVLIWDDIVLCRHTMIRVDHVGRSYCIPCGAHVERGANCVGVETMELEVAMRSREEHGEIEGEVRSIDDEPWSECQSCGASGLTSEAELSEGVLACPACGSPDIVPLNGDE